MFWFKIFIQLHIQSLHFQVHLILKTELQIYRVICRLCRLSTEVIVILWDLFEGLAI